MEWRDRIVVDPEVVFGRPVVKGTRLAVAFVIDLLAHGCTVEEVLDNYPQLTREDIHACLAYAGDLVQEQVVYPVGAAPG